MKKCRHANIVRLFEVIDDPQQDKIFLGEAWLHSIPTRYAEDYHELPSSQHIAFLNVSHGVSCRWSSAMDKWTSPACADHTADSVHRARCHSWSGILCVMPLSCGTELSSLFRQQCIIRE
jgi:hypothetical protein